MMATRAAMPRSPGRGFTLIELLIVVAIIAILAAIAVPNFLEAQVRAKLTRARSDLRTVATGLEAYRVDNNRYPLNDGVYNVLPIEITTPVAYLTNSSLVDLFSDKELDPVHGELERFYTYTAIVPFEAIALHRAINRTPANEAVDAPNYNPGAFQRYGEWRLVSNGPDRVYRISPRMAADPFNANPFSLQGSDIPYDATNGTVSDGNVLRTQVNPEGANYF
jgi:prepilin-type N-terminal cleavage/methylation domain-containing protein